jgi:uncharacterized protein YdeI (BOF family)
MRCSSPLCGYVADAWNGRLTRRCALAAVVAVAAFFALLPTGSASAWSPAPCTPNQAEIQLSSGIHCIGHRLIRSRGRIAPWCFLYDLPPGTIYPSRTFCGGVGPEYIAQARALTHLGHVSGGIRNDTQWEVETHDSRGGGRADITFEDDTLEVYEVKLTNNWRPDPSTQVARYVSALNGASVSPIAQKGDMFSGALAGWVDSFMVKEPSTETCTTPTGDALRFRFYVSWLLTDGVVAVYDQLLPCFNPVTEPPPVPVPVPVPVPGYEDEPVPVGQLPPVVVPVPAFPGTQVPTPTNPTGQPDGGPGPGGGPGGPVPTPVPAPVPTPVPIPPPDPVPNPGFPSFCDLFPLICYLPHLPGDIADAITKGEPHLTTLDGLGYDFQAVGEFQLAESDELGLDIQARMVPRRLNVSVVDRVAFILNGYRVEIEPFVHRVRIDGSVVDIPNGTMIDLGDGAVIMKASNMLYVNWPGEGRQPVLQASGGLVRLSIPRGAEIRGLWGNADGKPSNDLVTGSGEQLPANTSPSVIHGSYADSWRISDDESLFTYEAGESTDTFTDRRFPDKVLTIADLDDAALADATAQCSTAGVVDGRQFDDCVLDWALTQDSTFIESAVEHVTPVTEGGARTIDADGTAAEDFEAGIAPNFSSPRYGSGTGTGTFAGPFGPDGRYVFYVPELPPHVNATVKLDLIAIGDWSGDTTNNVTITVSGATAWRGSLATRTPSATGTTPSGQPYAVYPLSVTVPHITEQLNVGVQATLPIASSRAFAVDNVSARFALLAPETFDVTLPLSVTDGVPTAGAGNLETDASQDIYRFSTASARSIQVDVSNCASSLGYVVSWQLISAASGATVASGSCSSKLVPDLPAGDYRVVVSDNGRTGTYRLGLSYVAAPQVFDVALPVIAANGFPTDGVGNLETTSSEDAYRFTLATTSAVQLDFSSCSSSLSYAVAWKLTDTASGAVIRSATSCSSLMVPNLPAGSYLLSVTRNGKTGTYTVGIDVQAVPQVFGLTLPASVSADVPATGAGRLEVTSSEDVYEFTTDAAGGLQLDFSSCSSSLGYNVAWKLIDAATDAVLKSDSSDCASVLVSNVPAGRYRISVTRNGKTGTYKLGVLSQPAPQLFGVSLPVSVSDGVPSAGAGNLETTASEDAYEFTTAATGALQIDVSSCSSSVGYDVAWKLVDTATGAVKASDTSTCSSTLVPNIAAGRYRLSVTHNGKTGTYKLGVLSQPAPQQFSVSLPASISNGVPAAGAGNLETTASEDVYEFTTAATGAVQLDFSACSSSLASVAWKLVDVASGTV